MVSPEDAFLVLKKWRDEGLYVLFGPVDSHEQETFIPAETVRIKSVDERSFIVVLDRSELARWDLSEATFEYSEEQHGSPFPDSTPGQFPAVLEATFPDGFKLLFIEPREEPES